MYVLSKHVSHYYILCELVCKFTSNIIMRAPVIRSPVSLKWEAISCSRLPLILHGELRKPNFYSWTLNLGELKAIAFCFWVCYLLWTGVLLRNISSLLLNRDSSPEPPMKLMITLYSPDKPGTVNEHQG